MSEKDKKTGKVSDLTVQVSALQVQLDNQAAELASYKERADKAEGALAAKSAELERIEQERADEAAESPTKLKEQIRALVGKTHELQARLDEATKPENLRELVKARVQMERRAQVVLGDEVRVDELDDRTLMVKAIDRMFGTGKDVDEAGQARSDEYLKALFDSGVESFIRGREELRKVHTLVEDAPTTGATPRADTRSARQKMVDANKNAWKTGAQEGA